MKHSLLNWRFWRNFGAVVCLCLAAAVFIDGFGQFLVSFFKSERSYPIVYEALKAAWLRSFIVGLALLAGILSASCSVDSRIECVAAAGIGGVLTNIVCAFFFLFYGILGGRLWNGILFMVLSLYMATFLFCATIALNHRIRGKADAR